MTHLVHDSFKTKKALKDAIHADPSAVHLYDPSIYRPISGFVNELPADTYYVTNSKRRWFAQVIVRSTGRILVK